MRCLLVLSLLLFDLASAQAHTNSMDKFQDRHAAGIALARALKQYSRQPDTIVLALPRGGVPVAYEIAKALHLPLDVFIVRKLGVPGSEELAMGAIASGGVTYFNQDIIHDLHVSQAVIQHVIDKEKIELARRETVYRGKAGTPDVKGKQIILVDDGIATGATMRAAVLALRAGHAAKIIVAVPVADKKLSERIDYEVDSLICLLRVEHFYAVGAWYENFPQTEDEEVYFLLQQIRG